MVGYFLSILGGVTRGFGMCILRKHNNIIKSTNVVIWHGIFLFLASLPLSFIYTDQNAKSLIEYFTEYSFFKVLTLLVFIIGLAITATFLCAHSLKFAPSSITGLVMNSELFLAMVLDHMFIEYSLPGGWEVTGATLILISTMSVPVYRLILEGREQNFESDPQKSSQKYEKLDENTHLKHNLSSDTGFEGSPNQDADFDPFVLKNSEELAAEINQHQNLETGALNYSYGSYNSSQI